MAVAVVYVVQDRVATIDNSDYNYEHSNLMECDVFLVCVFQICDMYVDFYTTSPMYKHSSEQKH